MPTRRPVPRKLPSDRVTADFDRALLLLWNRGSTLPHSPSKNGYLHQECVGYGPNYKYYSGENFFLQRVVSKPPQLVQMLLQHFESLIWQVKLFLCLLLYTPRDIHIFGNIKLDIGPGFFLPPLKNEYEWLKMFLPVIDLKNSETSILGQLFFLVLWRVRMLERERMLSF